VNHKGRNRHFTNPEELEEQRRQEEKKQQWRVSIFRLIDTKRVIMNSSYTGTNIDEIMLNRHVFAQNERIW